MNRAERDSQRAEPLPAGQRRGALAKAAPPGSGARAGLAAPAQRQGTHPLCGGAQGFAHESTRHGTRTLFAALNVASGKVPAGHDQRRRREEFLDFLNGVLAEHPHGEIHVLAHPPASLFPSASSVVLDHLSTHQPKEDRWRRAQPRVHFHFTPTHASWLNQIEVWFSILSRQALTHASFTSPAQLRQAIDDFIAAYHPKAHPFAWTKVKVRQKKLANKYADLTK